MDINVLVVPCETIAAPYLKHIEDYDYRKGQAIVNGLIQPLDIESTETTVWCNEEGHLMSLPLNRRATEYLYTHAPEHRGFNVLVGDVYFTGLPDEDGNTTTVPESVVRQWID